LSSLKDISLRALRFILRVPTGFFLLLIIFYRKCVSPLLPPACRYSPTCSAYALEALREHGFFVGLFLSAWRILRCNPFGGRGYDPVPPKGMVISYLKRRRRLVGVRFEEEEDPDEFIWELPRILPRERRKAPVRDPRGTMVPRGGRKLRAPPRRERARPNYDAY
jgi:putative membrane protein insertion efficiency factor